MHVFSAIPAPKSRRIACLFVLACVTNSALAVGCKVAQAHTPDDAEQAYLRGDYDRAATLYQQQLQQKANDPELTVGLAQTLLKQQKVKAADDLVQKTLLAHPDSVPLLTALAEVQYREGTPWLVAGTADKAMKLDPCYAKLRLIEARMLSLSSYYASAAMQLRTAHALDPNDPDIRLHWFNTLPRDQRIAELESYLAAPTGADPKEIAQQRSYLESLKKEAAGPPKACRLVSPVDSTSVDFISLMEDGRNRKAFGLATKLNDHTARLEIDTGATGLLISRSVAERAGLKRFSDETVGGIGSEGDKTSYSAYADDIKIGALEFRDCQVEVLDKRSVVDMDGLIGMDTFASFLVTLDYPMRKLILGPLPKRPEDVAPRTPTLNTASTSGGDAAASGGSTPAPDAGAKPAPRGPKDRYVAPEMQDWTKVYRLGHDLMLPVALNNISQKLFILDTGAFATSISPEAAREVTKVRTDDLTWVKGISGRVDKVYSADKINFKFAHLSQDVEDVVSFDTSNLSKDLGLDVSGLIGITALGQTTMSIDYRDGLVKFSFDAHRGYTSSAFR